MSRHSPPPPTTSSSSSLSSKNKNRSQDLEIEGIEEIDRKIALATEGFTTNRFCELVLKDRNRLSRENVLTACNYIIAMKREINPGLCTIKNTIQSLAELSKSAGIEKEY